MVDWSAPGPLILGHRGASADAPENSLAAFVLAAEQGADGVELDVRLSADGHPVILHDYTVDRTTAGSGPVTTFGAAELAALGVPSLDDLFEAFGPTLLYNVELKTFSLPASGLAAAVADRVEAYGLFDRVLISSFNPLALRRARRHFTRRTRLAYLHHRALTRPLHRVARVEVVHPHFALVDPAYMAWAARHGYRVNVWTVDDAAVAKRMVDLGVHAIISNRPGALRAQLGL